MNCTVYAEIVGKGSG